MEFSSTLQPTYDEVELRIFQENDPASGGAVHYANIALPNGLTFNGDLSPIPEQLKRMEIGEPTAYGTELFQWLFPPNSSLHKALLQARWQAEAAQRSSAAKIRLRLWLDPESEDLHLLGWEAMYDPQREAPLALTMALSRFVQTQGPRIWPVAERPLRMLFVTSNPGGLDKFERAPIDTGFEKELMARATRGLGQSLQYTTLPNPTPGALGKMILEWHPHILYLLAHSVSRNGACELLFSDETQQAVPVGFEQLSALLSPSGPLAPQLVFLALPLTAETDFSHSVPGLGRRLVESGLQSTVALQAPIHEDQVVDFTSQFFAVLGRSGIIDEATMSARARIYTRGQWSWTYPVLYMRTPDAVLFQPLPSSIEADVRFLSAARLKR